MQPILLRRRAATAPFSPANIAGLEGWWKASDLALADGAAVSSWTDRSGNGNDLVQVVGAGQPLYKTNVLNGQPVVRFDGIDDNLHAAFTALAQPNTIIGVLKLAATTAKWVWDSFNDGSHRNGLEIKAGPVWALYAGSAEPSFGVPETTNAHVIVARYNGASSFGRVDGAQTALATPGAHTLGGFQLGGHTTGANFVAADFAEVLLYNSAPSGAELAAIEAYLKALYGTP